MAPVLRKPPGPVPSPYREESVLREPPALDRLNREATLLRESREERLFEEDSLLLRASTLERDYRGDGLLSAAARGQRGETMPRVRTPESDSAYKRYSSLLRGRSPERMEREARYAPREESPDPRYRVRSLGRDISPVRSFIELEEEEGATAPRLKESYSTLKSDISRASKAPPEPKRKAYKDSPKDLSI